MMQIRVKLMGMLTPQNPSGNLLELPGTALTRLGIHAARVQVYTVNGELECNRSRVPGASDEFSTLPPAGGA